MERKVDEIFTYNSKTYQIVESNMCTDCAFRGRVYGLLKLYTSPYTSNIRFDKTSIVFKEINNMKNNQLTINIPEGMEIDLEKSNLTKGIIKFKQNTTYEDVENTLKLDKNCTGIIVNKNNIHKLCAISKLMNIAKYYNKDWKPDWSNIDKYKYYIIYNGGDDTYEVDYNSIYTNSNIYFKNKEDAIAVINNPNFKDILDNIYKN